MQNWVTNGKEEVGEETGREEERDRGKKDNINGMATIRPAP